MSKIVCFKCHGKDFRELPEKTKALSKQTNISYKPTYKGTVLSITAKCSDLYSHTITNNEGYRAEHNGYVPSFFPNSYSGNDYIELEIDPYTGVILNWNNWTKKGETKHKKTK